MLNLALIIGSTRPNRFADHLAKWIIEGAAARSEFSLDVLDLRDYPLPFYNEPAPVAYTGNKYSEAAAGAWAQKLAGYDGYIATVAEYNHGPAAVLKNAFDSAFYEWQRKPVAFAGYGNAGGARAIEQMRSVSIELQMAPIKHDVNIGREPYLGVLREGKSFNDFDYLVQARTAVFDNLVWWGEALKAARAEPLRQAS
jgi:NAD(P)H-dependent FMN reductase